MQTPLVQIESLHKSFGRQVILRGVDLSVDRGQSIVIIGQSGCGKSVLLKHVVRLLEPDKGRVVVDDQDLADLDSHSLVAMRRRMGMLFQSAALFDSLTVAENVGLGLKESRCHLPEAIDDIVMEKLGLVGLDDAADKYPAELSGGMRKRVGLARAIADNPEILLYDEPTTGLDPITADVINDLIVALDEKLNTTSIAVTHDMHSAFKIADRIVMLHEGRIEFAGTPDDVRSSQDPIVRQFLAGQATQVR